MVRALLGLAGIAALATFTPAQGQSLAASEFSASSGLHGIRVVQPPPPGYPPGFSNGGGRGHGHHVHVGDQVAVGYGYGYAGGYYDYSDFDGNRSFDPDKWNDWWHDRPDRAFPRWMQNNQNCERIWYSGAGWRC